MTQPPKQPVHQKRPGDKARLIAIAGQEIPSIRNEIDKAVALIAMEYQLRTMASDIVPEASILRGQASAMQWLAHLFLEQASLLREAADIVQRNAADVQF